ncbi:spore germination protein GerPE [Paenibacillus planticolens]|uniref:Spore germination protein GerPE n=1 Tax=Paenibacillus planticolens TaxID=2654976 RepID=A0ABX1ZS63_9BACL|nr:spore germination protein GerPE [Paenibacillus planticolens]NOV02911.1 spore germination protein GerPE [Paenibacillus planticolens]
MARLSIVGCVRVTSISSSSVMQVGDNVQSALETKVFAVQREVPIYFGNEGSFAAYPFFRRPFPVPQPPEPFTMCVDNLGSFIRVRDVRIVEVSSSCLFQIGSSRIIGAEARVINIRQFVTNKPGPKGQTTFVKLQSEDDIGNAPPAIKPPEGL